ncbi:GSCOCT00013211001.2-RA-CDS [Cotesia congregata]|uniref:Cc_ptp.s_10.2 n=2 Tax=root TaxID=1 RepID=S6D4V2_COTCN|nr:PTPS [Bracoviriform congregatae]CAD6244026.1 GSCOCT00013211001.2-RA-CDS [Cotesia congregata]CAG17427.1 PTPS [Bracoviriform congregatae]CAG26738.1 protein tyrosine phosphatase [Bracoviriform congregatae]CAG5075827.1 cc_ptp.s_10.2 [Cotesia congregata]CCQ71298.1 protein tyrosine phosphatase PTPS [Cotesia congregata]
MATNLSMFVRVNDYIQRAKNPKCMDIIIQEHLEIINVPITSTCDNFYLPKNRLKNRRPDYPCWDVSRVVLKSNNGLDYINANHMAGFDGRCKFIATQEPMATTFDDFWSMVWQENSRIIVMLNGTKHESQPTSLQYFCVTQDHTILKKFVIKQESIRRESHYVYTKLSIVHSSSGEVRVIHHFKYVDWIETGVPDVGSFLDLLLAVNKQDQYYFKKALLPNQLPAGPIVVHGDMGVGRTAAFCVADICLYQIVYTATVSVPLIVLKARQQRRFSISTLNHYIFIHSFIAFFLVTIKSNPAIFLEFRSHLGIIDAYLLSLDFRPIM